MWIFLWIFYFPLKVGTFQYRSCCVLRSSSPHFKFENWNHCKLASEPIPFGFPSPLALGSYGQNNRLSGTKIAWATRGAREIPVRSHKWVKHMCFENAYFEKFIQKCIPRIRRPRQGPRIWRPGQGHVGLRSSTPNRIENFTVWNSLKVTGKNIFMTSWKKSSFFSSTR